MRLKALAFSIFVVLSVLAGCANGNQAGDDIKQRTYQVETNFNDYTNDELDIDLFKEIINSFSADEWDFMVLSTDKPINDCTFIQAGAPQEIVDFQYVVEVGINNKKSGLRVYRMYTEDKNEVLQYFVDYWKEQKIPDISSWSDVTDEIWG